MPRLGRRTGQIFGVALMLASGIGLANVATTAAHADPAYSFGLGNSANVLTGVGSDTIEDILAAYTGADNGISYPALIDKNNVQLASFNAVVPGTFGQPPTLGCIITKPNGPLIDRPNGSGAGQKALSDELQGVAWPQAGQGSSSPAQPATCNQAGGSPVPLGNAIDFARSSSGPSTSSPDQLRFVPFAHDALGVACYDSYGHSSAGDACHVTTAQLQSGYSNTVAGTFTDTNGDLVGVCMVNPNSGTAKFWGTNPNGPINVSLATEQSAATASGCGSTLEEHNGNGFYNAVNNVTGFASQAGKPKAWVVPLSSGQWIAQFNGVSFDRNNMLRQTIAGVSMGEAVIDGNAQNVANGQLLAPNSTFYGTSYGRDVYVVVSTTALTQTALHGGVADIQLMFGNSPSATAPFTPGNSPLDTNTNGGAVICKTTAQSEAVTFGLETTLVAGHSCGVGLPSPFVS